MTNRQQRSSHSPSIKELLEALTEEERRAAAPQSAATTRPATNGAGRHHATTGTSGLDGAHPAHLAHAALAAKPNSWTASSLQSVPDFEFEQGGGANGGSIDRVQHGAQVPRRAPPPPPSALIVIDADQTPYDAHGDFAPPSPVRVDRERALKLLQAHVRVPWIARHAFAAAGALAVILPSAFYLTAPVLDRVAKGQATAQPAAAIVQRGVSVTEVSTATAESPHTATSRRLATDTGAGSRRLVTGSLESMDQYVSLRSAPAPAPSQAGGVNGQSTDSTAVDKAAAQSVALKLSPDASRTMTPERAATLVARGRELAANRDITAARQYFQRAAEAGSALAAMEAARTYDPEQLRELGLIGLQADPQRARDLYRQAEAAGIAGAREMLDRLPTR
ncbi:MAG: hypothetical protein AB7U75_03795 [Hyphomicrobiaceae bacterium]